MILGIFLGFVIWFLMRYGVTLLFTLDQNERAVKTIFGKAERFEGLQGLEANEKDPLYATLTAEEKLRYSYPKLKVILPGGPYLRWPWEKVYKVSIATQTMNMAYDPDNMTSNRNGTVLEAVTKDQLNTGLVGQIRFRISDRNLYPYIFGVKNPISHVTGYFVSILRERIANFEAKPGNESDSSFGGIGVSINDLRKNLRELNENMALECRSSEARYGIVLDASLITGIEPPNEVESALAAINTAHNQISSDISLAQAKADQTIVLSRRAVEIETLKAQAESEPLKQMASQLSELKKSGSNTLKLYRKNIRLALLKESKRVFYEVER